MTHQRDTYILVEFDTSLCKVTAYNSTAGGGDMLSLERVTYIDKADLYVEYTTGLETLVADTRRDIVSIKVKANRTPVATMYKANTDPSSAGYDADFKTFASNLSGIILS